MRPAEPLTRRSANAREALPLALDALIESA